MSIHHVYHSGSQKAHLWFLNGANSKNGDTPPWPRPQHVAKLRRMWSVMLTQPFTDPSLVLRVLSLPPYLIVVEGGKVSLNGRELVSGIIRLPWNPRLLFSLLLSPSWALSLLFLESVGSDSSLMTTSRNILQLVGVIWLPSELDGPSKFSAFFNDFFLHFSKIFPPTIYFFFFFKIITLFSALQSK